MASILQEVLKQNPVIFGRAKEPRDDVFFRAK